LIRQASSLWAKYTVGRGALKGFYVGACAVHRGVLFYPTGPNAPGYTTVDAIGGEAGARWSPAVSARNLTDEIYNTSSTGANNIEPSARPTAQMSLSWRF